MDTKTTSPEIDIEVTYDIDDEIEPGRDGGKDAYYTTPEEGRAWFEYQAQHLMGMGGEEFIRRWEAGEYDEIADKAGHRHIMRLVMMIPFARQDP